MKRDVVPGVSVRGNEKLAVEHWIFGKTVCHAGIGRIILGIGKLRLFLRGLNK